MNEKSKQPLSKNHRPGMYIASKGSARMMHGHTVCAFLFGAFLFFTGFSFYVPAQTSRIPWQTMSEGMVSYTENNFRTVGIVGQVITGRSVDGNTVVTSGFLAGLRSSYAVSVKDVTSGPNGFNLWQNYPNPFGAATLSNNLTTTIGYRLRQGSFVVLRILDLLGRNISTLVNETQSAGAYSIQWDAAMQRSGLYVYRIEAKTVDGSSTFTDQKIMMLVR